MPNPLYIAVALAIVLLAIIIISTRRRRNLPVNPIGFADTGGYRFNLTGSQVMRNKRFFEDESIISTPVTIEQGDRNYLAVRIDRITIGHVPQSASETVRELLGSGASKAFIDNVKLQYNRRKVLESVEVTVVIT